MRPAIKTSRSVAPSACRDATTSRPWRRSAICIESKRASCSVEVQSSSAARSAGPTRARRCARNWRVLDAHQEAEEPIQDRSDDAAADRIAEREEQDGQEDQEPVLLEERTDLVLGPPVHEGEHHLGAVEGRDRDEV